MGVGEETTVLRPARVSGSTRGDRRTLRVRRRFENRIVHVMLMVGGCYMLAGLSAALFLPDVPLAGRIGLAVVFMLAGGCAPLPAILMKQGILPIGEDAL
ncbi:hypothetical protein [Bifidobacterium sp. SO1]|uniref:hypothetical protein n=1 Tax=Bifidobacterium sp. SO1 TaxID=2809029 RepID=UPI001BDC16BE|nr:hypothetical protein [Bifidobacterium sp. SO1]MBT1161714.1 hypothetical protein [Bifidobacterium sp. SO1]